MIELELVGIHNDGETVVLIDAEGRRYQLTIDDALRAAVRRDRPQLEQLRSGQLRPREIQVLIRAGATAAEVAEQGDLAIEQVRRYAGPVLAERAHVADRARGLLVGRESGAPALGDLVVDRLAARGIHELEWDARREGSDPWQVVATYEAEDVTERAVWQVDLAAQSFRAMDEHARLLTEADLAQAPRRHLSAVPPARVYDIEHDGDIRPALRTIDDDLEHGHPEDPRTASADDSGAETEALLAELAAVRGVRQPLAPPEHSEPTLWDDPARPDDPAGPGGPGSSQSPASAGSEADASGAPAGGDVVELPKSAPAAQEPAEPAEPAPAKRRSRSRRTSVPSWDEIVFGAKND